MELSMIFISLILLMFFAYRGYSIIFIAPLFAVVAALGSGHSLMPVYSEIYMTKAAEYIKTYYPVFLLGAVFAKIMEQGGLAAAVADKIVKTLGQDKAVLAVAGRTHSPLHLVLGGLAVGFGFQAVTNLIIFSADSAEAGQSVSFWMLGSMARIGVGDLPRLVVTAGLLAIAMAVLGPVLDALASGDRTAQSVGVEPGRARIWLLLPVSAAVAIAVASAGGIGFIGLIIPHIMRSFIGHSHRLLVVGTALAAALFCVWTDTAARIVFSPTELPLGVITGLVGAPFLVLIIRRSRTAW